MNRDLAHHQEWVGMNILSNSQLLSKYFRKPMSFAPLILKFQSYVSLNCELVEKLINTLISYHRFVLS